MREWTERRALISTVAFALRQLRPLLRRIVAEKHQPLDSIADPAEMAAEQIIKHLELSRYEVRHIHGQPKRHRSP